MIFPEDAEGELCGVAQGIRQHLRWLMPDGVKKRRVKTRRFGGMNHGKDGFAFLFYRFECQDSWRNLLVYNKR